MMVWLFAGFCVVIVLMIYRAYSAGRGAGSVASLAKGQGDVLEAVTKADAVRVAVAREPTPMELLRQKWSRESVLPDQPTDPDQPKG